MKRRTQSDNTEASEPTFHRKRMTSAPVFGGGETDSLNRQQIIDPPLDVHRAESSRKHVRALNSQFACWVQSQLENHPDELWQEGVQDYLSHASHIMEEFSDIVKWLKAREAKSEISAIVEQVSDKNVVNEVRSGKLKLQMNSNSVRFSKEFPTADKGEFTQSNSTVGVNAEKKMPSETNNSDSKFQPFGTMEFARGTFDVGMSTLGQSTSSAMLDRGKELVSLKTQEKDDEPKFEIPGTVGFTQGTQSMGIFGFNQSISGVGVASEKILTIPVKNNEPKVPIQGIFGFSQCPTTSNVSFAQTASTMGFGTSWNSSVFSSGQSISLHGNPDSNLVQHGPSSEVDGDDDTEQPSSPSLKKTEEKGVILVHEVKCKVYVKPEDPSETAWKDMGTGQLSIKCKEGTGKGTPESKPIIVVRNEVGKILLNAFLYKGIKMNIQKNTIATIFHTSGAGSNNTPMARTYLLRTKSKEDIDSLATAIREYAPAS